MKVISFCLWGNKPQYTIGAIKNVELAYDIYPGWRCHFYISKEQVNEWWVDALYQSTFKVDIIPVPRPPNWLLMLDRFLPASDPDVEVMLSRDCDSRLSLREKLAVDKWLASDKQFLVLKDHPWHAGVPILGGLWGVKRGLLPNMSQMINDFIQEDPRNEWQCDQRFLTDKIWPKVQHTAMIFDPFYGGLNYPIPRDGFEFCGSTNDENDRTPQEQIDLLQKHWRP